MITDKGFHSTLASMASFAALKREAAAYLNMQAEELRWMCIMENLRAAAELAECARPTPGAMRYINTREVSLDSREAGRDSMGVRPI